MTKERITSTTFFFLCFIWTGYSTAHPGTILNGNGLVGGLRWNAEPRSHFFGERSLDGGLRYSLEGSSFEAYRNFFTWDGATPSVSDFQQSVEQAFAAWESVDPVSGLGTDLYFVQDFSTPVEGSNIFGNGSLFGAEIDLLAADDGPDGYNGFAVSFADFAPVTLTSGTSSYPGTRGFTGVDIQMNTAKVWTLNRFRRTLTHEIGHAIGIGDAETDIDPEFIDDNYDGTNSATALATLTNSWANLIDPFDPAASPLSVFTVPNGDPGVDTPGVDLLMESNTTGISSGNPLSSLVPLTNDEYAMRQFLYPVVIPEPASSMLLLLASMFLATARRFD